MLPKRLIGSQLALVFGASGILSGVANAAFSGGSAPLRTATIMVLGAAAYGSRKRRLLGLKPGTVARKSFEAFCLSLIAMMWVSFPDLGNAIGDEPVPHLIVPLWALIAYTCAGAGTGKEVVVPPAEHAPSSTVRMVLWSAPVALASSVAVASTLLSVAVAFQFGAGASAAPGQQADVELLKSAQTLRCSFESFGTDLVFDLVDYDAGTARLVGNAGTSPLSAVPGLSGVSFIEVTPSGAVNTYTVYAWLNAERRFVAVTSRHTAVAGPSPSQLNGSCDVQM